MIKMKKVVAVLMAFALLPTMGCGDIFESTEGREQITITTSANDTLAPSALQSALKIRSYENEDFPSRSNLSSSGLEAETTAIIDYSKLLDVDTILLEVRSSGEALYRSSVFPTSQYWLEEQGDFSFYDPLKQFSTAGQKEGINTMLLVNPFYLGSENQLVAKSSPLITNPDDCVNIGGAYYFSPTSDLAVSANLEDITDLWKSYEPTGIILTGIDDFRLTAQEGYVETLQQLISGLQDAGVILGVELSTLDLEEELLEELTQDAEWVLAPISGQTTYTDNVFGDSLEWLCDIVGEDRVVPVLTPVVGEENDLIFQNYLVQDEKLPVVYSGLSDLQSMPSHVLPSLVTLSTSYEDYWLEHTFEPVLEITYPRQNYSTNASSYCITGSSDPDQTLTVDGVEIERYTEDGSFSVLLDLDYGTNVFTFKQDYDTVQYTIERYVPDETSVSTTDKISSMYPSSYGVIFGGEEASISCVAPSGAVVSVTINGENYPLTQAVATAVVGVPATFRGEVTLESGTTLENIGKPVYYLSYGGVNTSYTANGDLYLAPAGMELYGEVQYTTQSVYPTTTLSGDYDRLYREGTVEQLVTFGDTYVETLSGGYLPIGSMVLLAPEDVPEITITEATVETTDDSVVFTLVGGAGIPYVIADEGEGDYRLVIYSPKAIGELTIPTSPIFSDVTPNYDNTEAYELLFTATDDHIIWGYDVFYNGEDAEIYFKLAPTKSDDALLPLKNLVVVLDPGHGGDDIGAPSTLRTVGPHEADFALSTSYFIQAQLERLGATVVMTRMDDSTFSLSERSEITAEASPHISMSVHYNSHAETTDANTVSGIETYYHYGNGEELAVNLGEVLSAATDRPLRWSSYGNYIVTKYPFTSSILLETGYMPNPLEYAQTMTPFEMYKVGVAVADVFTQYVEDYGKE